MMANIEKPVSPLEEVEKNKISHQRVGGAATSPVVVEDQPDEGESSDKELPEPIRPPRKMPSLPPIGISQVKDMLTRMPEQSIMRQVANNLTSGAYHSDDSGSEMAMQGLFDCIVETTLHHHDDDDNDEENSPKELPCAFCSKVFNNKMRLQTHILVMHSQEDPSLLNVTHVAPRRELQRSHSNSKTGGSEANDAKARPLSQGLFNMDVSQVVESDLVKHLPPKQRVKLGPKARLLSKDQAELRQSGRSLDVTGDSTVIEPIPQTTISNDTAHPKVISSPEEGAHSRTSKHGNGEDLTSTACLSSQKIGTTEQSVSEESRITRRRGRSGSRIFLESSSTSSSSSSLIHSPGPSGETRRSSRQQVKLNEPLSSSLSSLPLSKRKNITSMQSEVECKKNRISVDASGAGTKRSNPSKRSR